jgi:uncharacterized membrane protein (UPF0127 family)
MHGLTALFCLLLVTASAACTADVGGPAGTGEGSPSPPQGHAWVVFGADTVTAEVADTDEEREQGLMYRQNVASGAGMLFVWTDEDIRSFWMKNTYVPLDVGFLDRNQVLINVRQMEPDTQEIHSSDAPAMFALEVPQGWFASRSIAAGTRAVFVFGPT